jgi:hypothetical protein
MQIRWAVGLVLVAALCGCAREDHEAQYLRALQTYSLEQEMVDKEWRPLAAARAAAIDKLLTQSKEASEENINADPAVAPLQKRYEMQLDRLEYAAKKLRELEAAHPRKP